MSERTNKGKVQMAGLGSELKWKIANVVNRGVLCRGEIGTSIGV